MTTEDLRFIRDFSSDFYGNSIEIEARILDCKEALQQIAYEYKYKKQAPPPLIDYIAGLLATLEEQIDEVDL